MMIQLAPAPEPPQRVVTAWDLLGMRQAVADFVYWASRADDDHTRDWCLRQADDVRRKIERHTGEPEPMPEMEPRYIGVQLHASGRWFWEYLYCNGRKRIRKCGFRTARDAAIARERYFDARGITNVLRNQL